MNISIPDNFDFGFSFATEEELSQPKVQTVQTELDDVAQTKEKLEKKIQTLEKMIMPLLENLKKDPDKEYVKWPNRTEQINKFIQSIQKVIND